MKFSDTKFKNFIKLFVRRFWGYKCPICGEHMTWDFRRRIYICIDYLGGCGFEVPELRKNL
jgi:hypothetical protein